MLADYDRLLVIALRHRFVTLMAMLATIAATAWLFVVIPKGFFPEQDTGLILGVTDAAQDVSPDGMAAMQQRVIAAVELIRRSRRSALISARAAPPRPRTKAASSSH